VSLPAWASNAVTCLVFQPDERFLAIVDEPFADVGLRLCDAATAAGARFTACIVCPDSERPFRRRNEQVLAALGEADAAVMWFAQVHDGEFGTFRQPIYRRIKETGTRMAFGARMDRSILETEMSADYAEVRDRSARLLAALGSATRIRVTTPAGTDCTFDVSGRTWRVDDGTIDEPGTFGNLPAGEVFIAPIATGADGICVVDRSIAVDGVGLVDEPIRLRWERGRIVAVEGGREAQRVRDVIAGAGDGADVVAELGIGTNERARVTGNVITDEKALGTAHVAFGDNTGDYGGDNVASIHVDGIMADATIEADGRVVMNRGELV
jgi:leucyl aminopeptidase (aminopeptidase T)